MGEKKLKKYTIPQYLALEEQALEKHEYHNGEILAMSGGTPIHSRLGANIIKVIGNAIDKAELPCDIYNSDRKIYIESVNHFVYPDAFVVCGDEQNSTQDENAVTNPILVVEVLSKSTANYDRTDKFRKYCSLPSFKEYVLITQDQPIVETLYKADKKTWHMVTTIGLHKSFYLHTIESEIQMTDVYKRIKGLREPQIMLDFD